MKKLAFIIALALVLSMFAIPASAEKLVFEGEGETIADTFDLPKTDTPIVIDGKLDEAYGDPIWIVKGASRYTDPDAFAIHPPTDYSDEVLAVGSAVDSWFYFRWDAEYLYLCAQTTKQFTTDALSKQDPWKAGTDCIQASIIPEDTSNGEIGFSIVSPEDLSEAWVWFFNNMATGSGDIAEEASPASVTFENGLTTWEIAISWTDALCTVPAEGDKYSIGIAFFFGTDVIGSMGYQVGRYVFNNGRDLALNPVATLTGVAEEPAPELVDETVHYFVVLNGEWVEVGQTTQAYYPFGDTNRWYVTTEQIETVLGEYGFKSADYKGEAIFPHAKVTEAIIWADVFAIDLGDGNWAIPIGNDQPEYSMYYCPGQPLVEADQDGNWMYSKSKDDAAFKAANELGTPAPATTTTTSNPSTSDISVIYYALTALAAAGFVFTKKR